MTTIYGLVGQNHLSFLDSIGATVTEEANYKHIKVKIHERTIDAYLFGGTHGEMAHYEMLRRHAEQQGLTVPPPPTKSKKEKNDKLLKALIDILLSPSSFDSDISEEKKSSGTQIDNNRFFSMNEQNSPKKKVEDAESILSIDAVATLFDHWVKNPIADIRPIRSDNEDLLDWLQDRGAKHIKTYDRLCELAQALNKIGYSTVPPPTEEEFKEITLEFTRRNAKFL